MCEDLMPESPIHSFHPPLPMPMPMAMAFSASLFSVSLTLPLLRPKMPSSSPVLIPKPQHLSLPLRRSFSAAASAAPSTPPPPSPSFDLRGYWTALIAQIESELDTAVPVRYPNRIYEAMRYSVLAGAAKRAPPVMCVAACELFGGHRSAAFPTACALEMVHAASLVHDDLPCMDAAPLRRGRPSTHSVFGVDMAILAGDALFPLCFSHIVNRTPPALVPEEITIRVIAEIARAVGSGGMAAGQFLDLDGAAAGDGVVTVLEKKFGEMAECSAVCGGLLGGAGEEEAERLRRYGRAVGVLYQLVDDILMEEVKGVGSNGHPGKMRSNASVVKALGMDRAIEILDEYLGVAKRELEGFGEKYGDRVLPLYSFVDYAVDRRFVVEGTERVAVAVAAGGGGGVNGDIMD